MSRILPISILLTLLLAQLSFAEEKEKLFSRVISVPSGAFRVNGSYDASIIRLLPPTLDGERRYDVLGWLENNGLKRKPGMSAILLENSNAVVIKASAEDFDLSGRMLESSCEGAVKIISTSANLWTFEADGLLDPLKYPHTLAELRGLAGSSLKLLDAQTLVTKSGNRTVGENLGALPPKTPTPAPKETGKPAAPKASEASPDETGPDIDAGSRGSVFELEPNIGPDGETMDFQISYKARFAQANGEPDAIVNVSTNSTLQDGHDMVLWLNGVPGEATGGKVRHRAFTVSMQILDQTGTPQSDRETIRKRQEAANRELIRRAQEGIVAE